MLHRHVRQPDADDFRAAQAAGVYEPAEQVAVVYDRQPEAVSECTHSGRSASTG
jgi:hypothetical protein